MKNWLKIYQWHIISWSIFILYEYFLVALILNIKGPLLVYCMHYIINISLFYIHSDLILKKTLAGSKPRYFTLIALVIVEIFGFSIIAYVADQLILTSTIPFNLKNVIIDWKFIFGALWRGIYFILFGTAYYFVKRYIQQKQLPQHWKKKPSKKSWKKNRLQ